MQRNAVPEGIALGLMMCDRDELPKDELRVDSALMLEFPKWKHARKFPRVLTDISRRLKGWHIITHARKHHHTIYFHWGDGLDRRKFFTYFEYDFEASDVAESIHQEIPAEDWRALTQAILARCE